MELTQAEFKLLDRIRKVERLQTINVWVLGVGALAFLLIGMAYLFVLMRHLHGNSVGFIQFLEFLSRTNHPDGANAGIVFVAASLIPVTVWTAFQLLAYVFLIRSRSKTHQLLLKLANQIESAK